MFWFIYFKNKFARKYFVNHKLRLRNNFREYQISEITVRCQKYLTSRQLSIAKHLKSNIYNLLKLVIKCPIYVFAKSSFIKELFFDVKIQAKASSFLPGNNVNVGE